MPELPDLQVFSKNLDTNLRGKTVKKVTVVKADKIKSPEALEKNLKGRKIKNVYREGKEIHFLFDDDTILGVHLMLHGNLYYFNKKNSHKYPIMEMLFDDDTGLALTDFQGQAVPTLNPQVKESPDALSRKVTAAFLKKQMENTRASVKNLLMDQQVIRGIGNAYVDEILWDAKISPFSVSNKIPSSKIDTLAGSIKKVLREAEHEIERTHPDIINGEFREFLKIHNSKKKESPGGAPILQKTAGSRKTYYTPEQEEFT
jgi:formamidopyrimidine-DNA glycosylase